MADMVVKSCAFVYHLLLLWYEIPEMDRGTAT